MRLASGAEMFVAYLLLPGLMIVLWKGTAAMRALALFCVTTAIIFSLVIPNIGTIYRMRYIFFHVLLGLGIVGYGCLSGSATGPPASRHEYPQRHSE